jgi:IS5 family transposase
VRLGGGSIGVGGTRWQHHGTIVKRISELCELTWDRVDFATADLVVKRAREEAAGEFARRWCQSMGPRVDRAIPAFGYKNHLGIDRRHRLIRRWRVTDAARYDGALLPELIDSNNTASEVWADTAYRSKGQ